MSPGGTTTRPSKRRAKAEECLVIATSDASIKFHEVQRSSGAEEGACDATGQAAGNGDVMTRGLGKGSFVIR